MDLSEVYDTIPTFDLSADLPLDPPEPGMVALYALIDPRDGAIRYIGKTATPRHRLANHCAGTFRRLTNHKQRWINQLISLGYEPSLRILAWVDHAIWAATERAFIAEARCRGCRLTNATAGGEGVEGRPASARSVAHLIAYNKVPNPEKVAKAARTRKARGTSLAQRVASAANLRRASERRSEWEKARLEGLRSEEARAKMSAAQLRFLEDPQHAAVLAERWIKVRQAGRTPDARAKNGAALRAYFADPAHRAKRGAEVKAAFARRPKRVLSAHERQRLAALQKDSHATPQARENMRRAQQERRARERETPDVAARNGQSTRQRWADPEYKARVSAAISAGKRRRHTTAQDQDQETEGQQP